MDLYLKLKQELSLHTLPSVCVAILLITEVRNFQILISHKAVHKSNSMVYYNPVANWL